MSNALAVRGRGVSIALAVRGRGVSIALAVRGRGVSIALAVRGRGVSNALAVGLNDADRGWWALLRKSSGLGLLSLLMWTMDVADPEGMTWRW